MEFALILPIFLVIIFAIIEFAIALLDKAVITNASREAARAGIVFQVPKLNQGAIQTVAQNYCTALAAFGSSPAPTVKVNGAQGAFGTPLSVEVDYDYTGLKFLVGPVTMTAITVMNNE